MEKMTGVRIRRQDNELLVEWEHMEPFSQAYGIWIKFDTDDSREIVKLPSYYLWHIFEGDSTMSDVHITLCLTDVRGYRISEFQKVMLPKNVLETESV